MKKLLLLSLIVIGQLSYAQRIDVKSIKLLNGTEQGGYFHPIFSPQGTYLLTTAENYAGLNRHVIATNKIERLVTDAGAGYGVQISADENTILFKKTEIQNSLRFSSLQSYSLNNKRQEKLIDATHEKISPVFVGNAPAVVKAGVLKKMKNI